ncbi:MULTISPECIES: DUF4646 domain-containing protein [Pseudomonadaceae]|nr:DUF4646 domain-containing protein [Stutzerimonas stutzeri]UWG61200.1 DUF4646 domain-containing protein [Stutzerimonas stutzeri]
MEPVGYLMLGAVLALVAIGIGGYLTVKKIDKAMNSKKS